MREVRRLAFVALVAAGLAACSVGSTPIPSASSSPPIPSPSGSAEACGPSPSACAMPSSAPASPSPGAASPSPSPTPCPIGTAGGSLTTDRLVAVQVQTGAAEDRVTFVLGPPLRPAPGTLPAVQVAPAAAPFVADPSGLPLRVDGQRFARVRFEGMSLYDATGTPTYSGPLRFDEPGPGMRSIVREGSYEGIESWIVGFDGPGCVGVDGPSATSLTVRLSHP